MIRQLPIEPVPLGAIIDTGGGLEPFYRVLGDLGPLKQSIRKYGLMVPPTVWKLDGDASHGAGAQYAIIDGARRIAALRELRAEADDLLQSPATVACSVCAADLATAKILSIHAHEERKRAKKARPGHVAEVVQRLLEEGKKQREIEKLLHISQATVSTLKTLSDWLTSDAMHALQSGDITMNDGLRLVAISKERRIASPANKMCSNQEIELFQNKQLAAVVAHNRSRTWKSSRENGRKARA